MSINYTIDRINEIKQNLGVADVYVVEKTYPCVGLASVDKQYAFWSTFSRKKKLLKWNIYIFSLVSAFVIVGFIMLYCDLFSNTEQNQNNAGLVTTLTADSTYHTTSTPLSDISMQTTTHGQDVCVHKQNYTWVLFVLCFLAFTLFYLLLYPVFFRRLYKTRMLETSKIIKYPDTFNVIKVISSNITIKLEWEQFKSDKIPAEGKSKTIIFNRLKKWINNICIKLKWQESEKNRSFIIARNDNNTVCKLQDGKAYFIGDKIDNWEIIFITNGSSINNYEDIMYPYGQVHLA